MDSYSTPQVWVNKSVDWVNKHIDILAAETYYNGVMEKNIVTTKVIRCEKTNSYKLIVKETLGKNKSDC